MGEVMERKSLEANVTGADDGKPFGGFVAIASTPSRDRDGDVLSRDEWLPLPDRLTVDADHGMSVASTIGSARPYFDDSGRLMIDAAFSSIDRAQEVRTLIREGHVSTVSVAFLTDQAAKAAGLPFRELLNVGVVSIPANPDAVILDAKSAGLEDFRVQLDRILAGEDDVVTKAAGGGDAALVQAIHDASCHLGAACSGVVADAADDDADAKALAALAIKAKALALG